jgi:2,4-dienoyl-CoA reductase-like NADH-dependent reductase (Old Yellow Enzyme family)
MAHAPLLFTPLKIKSVEFKNRIWMSPMCQYSSDEGLPTDWHFVHLGSRAVGGAGLVMVEATAVSPEGRISPGDSGIWSDEHIAPFKRITDFVKVHGAVAGMQLAHAGRKASTAAPWEGGGVLPEGDPRAWVPLAPNTMTAEDIKKAVYDFAKAAKRAYDAGFQVVDLHMAHGYLMHGFLSPLSNERTDEYGGSLENRMRFPLLVAKAVRAVWPDHLPLFARISATDWAGGPEELELIGTDRRPSAKGWNIHDSISLCEELQKVGVDLIDCSSGGTLAKAKIPSGPGYQTPFAEQIRKTVGIKTAAVGLITSAVQAEGILHQQQADAIFIARQFLRDAYFPVHAAKELNFDLDRPKQYARA